MKKRSHNINNVKLQEDDVIIDIVTHDGKKMYHCCLSEKHQRKDGNHILHQDIVTFYWAIIEATKGQARYYYFIDKKVGDLFDKVHEVLKLGIELLETDKGTLSTKDILDYKSDNTGNSAILNNTKN